LLCAGVLVVLCRFVKPPASDAIVLICGLSCYACATVISRTSRLTVFQSGSAVPTLFFVSLNKTPAPDTATGASYALSSPPPFCADSFTVRDVAFFCAGFFLVSRDLATAHFGYGFGSDTAHFFRGCGKNRLTPIPRVFFLTCFDGPDRTSTSANPPWQPKFPPGGLPSPPFWFNVSSGYRRHGAPAPIPSFKSRPPAWQSTQFPAAHRPSPPSPPRGRFPCFWLLLTHLLPSFALGLLFYGRKVNRHPGHWFLSPKLYRPVFVLFPLAQGPVGRRIGPPNPNLVCGSTQDLLLPTA